MKVKTMLFCLFLSSEYRSKNKMKCFLYYRLILFSTKIYFLRTYRYERGRGKSNGRHIYRSINEKSNQSACPNLCFSAIDDFLDEIKLY
jgi:hypothetical protein